MATDIFRRAALMGIGIMSLTEAKVKELVKELETKGEVTEKESKDLLKDLIARADKEKKAIEENIKKGIKDYLAKINIASREDVIKLEKRVKGLEEKVKELIKAVEE
jgi:polyhydroxyalkanoate synthesis regulator phasin